jgi:hypothetical protein
VVKRDDAIVPEHGNALVLVIRLAPGRRANFLHEQWYQPFLNIGPAITE